MISSAWKNTNNSVYYCKEIYHAAKVGMPLRLIYDPVEGYYENGVNPDTAWEDVPTDCVIPKCGAEKEDFWKAD